MNRAPLTRAYTEIAKLGGIVSRRVVLNGDVCMLGGTITALDTDAPGGGVTAATGLIGERCGAFGTTGSSAHATRAARQRSALVARRAPRGVQYIDVPRARGSSSNDCEARAFRGWLQHPRSNGRAGGRSRTFAPSRNVPVANFTESLLCPPVAISSAPPPAPLPA